MTESWRIAVIKKQSGSLDKVSEFLPNDTDLKAVEIIVPIEQDIKKAVTTADNLISSATRSFEIIWDKNEKKLAFWLVSIKTDIDSFTDSFRAVYPNADFIDVDGTIPSWYDKTQQYRIFDASVRHGHFYAVMNYQKWPDLITRISNTIQKAQYGWIQLVFRSYDATKKIEMVGMNLDKMYQKVTDHKHVTNWELLVDPNKKPHDHPEMGGEFARNYKTLRQHNETKVINPQLMMSIRGMIKADVELDFDFEVIQNFAFENVKTTFENITKHSYDYSKFYTSDKKKTEFIKIGNKKTHLQRIDMFPLRLLPKPHSFIDNAVSHYVSTNLFGRYHKRKPLPFLVLNISEMSLFVNLPDSTVKYIKLTRGQNMPKATMNKDGFELGDML